MNQLVRICLDCGNTGWSSSSSFYFCNFDNWSNMRKQFFFIKHISWRFLLCSFLNCSARICNERQKKTEKTESLSVKLLAATNAHPSPTASGLNMLSCLWNEDNGHSNILIFPCRWISQLIFYIHYSLYNVIIRVILRLSVNF